MRQYESSADPRDCNNQTQTNLSLSEGDSENKSLPRCTPRQYNGRDWSDYTELHRRVIVAMNSMLPSYI